MLRDGEIELVVDGALNFRPVQTIRSAPITVENFTFNLLVFPRGAKASAGKSFGAFVEAVPGDVEPDSEFPDVHFEITLVNWQDFGKSITKSDRFTFKAAGTSIDRGWHDLRQIRSLSAQNGWLSVDGSACVRARCIVNKSADWS